MGQSSTRSRTSTATMPRARKLQIPKHEVAVPLQRTREDDEDTFAMDAEMQDGEELGVTVLDEGEYGGRRVEEDSLAAAGEEAPVTRTKKDKKKSKHDALMQRLIESSRPVSPYSKSHNRREKRKSKQSMGLDSMTAALDEAVPVETMSTESARNTQVATASGQGPVPPSSSKASASGAATSAAAVPGKIGSESRQKSLSSKQRQKMLAHERTRLPAVLAHKSFAASPFETIRLHAQNTVVPLEKGKKAK